MIPKDEFAIQVMTTTTVEEVIIQVAKLTKEKNVTTPKVHETKIFHETKGCETRIVYYRKGRGRPFPT